MGSSKMACDVVQPYQLYLVFTHAVGRGGSTRNDFELACMGPPRPWSPSASSPPCFLAATGGSGSAGAAATGAAGAGAAGAGPLTLRLRGLLTKFLGVLTVVSTAVLAAVLVAGAGALDPASGRHW